MASIQDLYLQILGRPADPGGKAFYEQQLASGTKTLDQIAADLQYVVDTGAENKALNQAATQQTIAAYKSVLGRDPTDPNNLDLEGLGFYTAKNINEGTGAVVNDLVYSTEGQKIEQAKIQTRQDEQQKIKDESAARAANIAAARNNQIADTLQKTVDRAQAVGDTNTVNKLTDQIARLRGETTDTTKTGTTLTGTTVTGATGADPNRVQAVTDLYWNTFYRAPDAEGLAFYTTGGGKNIPINELAGVFQNEPEGKQVANVANLYTTYFGRAPDAEGVRTFVDRFGDTIDDQELFYFLDTGRLNNENVSQAGLDFIKNYTGSRDFEKIDPGFRQGEVTNLFKNILYRDPDPAGLEYYTTGGGKDIPLDQLATIFRSGPEGTRVADLEKMYRDYFGRDPDAAGIRYYYDMFGETIDPSERMYFLDTAKQQGTETLSQAALDFMANYKPPETPVPGLEKSVLPTQATTADPRRVSQLYYELLGRAPDPEGLAYWSSQPAYNLESSFYKTAVPEIQQKQAEQLAQIPIKTAIPTPVIGQPSEPTAQELYLGLGRAPDPAGLAFWESYSQPGREQAFAAEAQKQGLAYDPTKPMTIGLPGQPTTTSLSGMTPQQRDLARLMVSKMPTGPAATSTMFSPENVASQLELERLRLQPTPETPEIPVVTETPVAGFAQGGLVGNDINRMLQNQRNAIQRESQSRQMLTGLGAPPVKKFSDGGPAGSSSSGVRRLKMSGYQDGGEVTPVLTPEQLDEFNRNMQRELDEENRQFQESGGQEFYSAIRPAMEDINERVKQTLELYRMGRATEADVRKLIPSMSEWEIASQFGRTDTGGYRLRDIDAPSKDRLRDFIEIQKPTIDTSRPDMFPYDPRGSKAQERVLKMSEGGDVSNDAFIQEMMTGTLPKAQGPSPVDTAVSDFISSRSKLVTDPQEFFRVMGENLETYHGKPLREDPEKYLMEQLGPGALAGTIKKAGGQFIPYYGTKTPEDIAKDFTSGGSEPGSIVDQLDNWIMSRLPRYIKNQMGTESDPLVKMVDDQTEKAIKQLDAYDRRILKLQNEIKARESEKGPGSARASQERLMDEIEARQEFLENSGNFLLPNNRLFGVRGEQEDVLAAHESSFLRAPAATPSESGSISARIKKSREKQGFPAEGTARTRPGRTVEEIIDESFRPTTLRELFNEPTASSEDLKKAFETDFRTAKTKLPDNLKLDPNEVFYGLDDRYVMDVLGGPASHMLDELNNAMRPGTNLPPSLQIKPENLNQFDFERAMRHVSKIDEWRMQQSRGADLEGGMKSAAVYKEYPDSPRELRWVRLKADESLPKDEARKQLQEALDREGNIMGHCVGAYCDPVLEGRTEIYSLRDSRGKSHVTIEVNNNKNTSIGTFLDEVPGQAEKYGFTRSDSGYGWIYPRKNVDGSEQSIADEIDKTVVNSPEFKQWLDSQQKQIRQIKGKGNDKQKDAYTPYVQDFVRTGNWDINNIGDFENTDLVLRGGKLYTKEEEAARMATEMARVEPLIAEAKEFIYKDPVFDFIRKANEKRFDMSVNNPRFRRLEDIERFDLTPDGYNLRNIEAMLDDPEAYMDRGETVLDVYQRVLAKVDEIKSNLPSIQKAAEKYGPEVDRYAAGGEVTAFIKRQAGSPPEGEISNDEFIKSLGDRSRSDLATIKEAIAEIGKNKDKYAFLESRGFTPTDIEDPVKNAAYGLFLTSKTSEDPQRFLSTLSPFYDSKIEFDYTTDRSTLGEVQPYSTEARVYTTDDRGVALHELVHTLQMRRAKDIAEGKKEINQPMSRTVGDKVFQRAADLAKKGEITFPATNWKQDKGELMANVYDMSRKYEEAGKDFTKSIEFKKLFPDEESQLYYYTQTLPDTSVVYPAGSSFEPLKTRDKSKSYARQLLGFATGGEVTDFIKRVA